MAVGYEGVDFLRFSTDEGIIAPRLHGIQGKRGEPALVKIEKINSLGGTAEHDRRR